MRCNRCMAQAADDNSTHGLCPLCHRNNAALIARAEAARKEAMAETARLIARRGGSI